MIGGDDYMINKIDDVMGKITNLKENTKIKEVIINMTDKRFKGDVLDVGMDNYGIVYHMCKKNNDEISVDYIDSSVEGKTIGQHLYDTAVLFFTLNKVFLDMSKRKLLEKVWHYLKEDGEIVIWDLDKPSWQHVNLNVRVLMPGDESKVISFRDFNVLKDSSKEYIVDILEPLFEIVECNASDNIYYIRGRKIRKE
jgi:hypothetical protein